MTGFTIVELLVVIVVIGVLATVTIVSYSGISRRAIEASLQADLASSASKLKLYYAEYGTYPQSLDANNCPQSPADSKYCIKTASGNTVSYCTSSPYNTFLLVNISSSGVGYQITDNTPPQTSGSSPPVFCSGGAITQNGSVRTHTFDGTCTSAVPCTITANSAGSVTITASGAGGGGGRDDEELGSTGGNGDKVVYTLAIAKGDILQIIVGKGSVSASAPTSALGYTNGITGGNGGQTSCAGGAGDTGPGLPGVGGAGSSGVKRLGIRLIEAKGGAGGKSGGFYSDPNPPMDGCNEWTAGGLGGAGGGTNFPALTTAGGGGVGGAHGVNGTDGSVTISY